jgi:hypothetical protein
LSQQPITKGNLTRARDHGTAWYNPSGILVVNTRQQRVRSGLQ